MMPTPALAALVIGLLVFSAGESFAVFRRDARDNAHLRALIGLGFLPMLVYPVLVWWSW
jgi:hypothetical protein